MTQVRVVLTGGSGFIGTSLIRLWREKPIQITQLVRRPPAQEKGQLYWDPYSATPFPDPSSLEGAMAAVHLSGANIVARRWTKAYKELILQSRQQPTHAFARLLSGLRVKPRVLISVSAVGIFGSRGDEKLSEGSLPGSDFLAEVCQAWEGATLPAADAGIRVVHLRLGMALSPGGGAFARMLPIFRLGLGGRLGSDRQWMSWIALDDALRAIEFAIRTEELAGPVNVVAPEPLPNQEFTRILGRVLRRPTPLLVPALALKLAFGGRADAVLTSQRAFPERLEAAGFRFQYPQLGAALASMTSGPRLL